LPRPDAARDGRALHVTVVADNPQTLAGVEKYLQRAGVTTNGTKHVDRLSEMTPPVASVVLLFPDDFHSGSVMAALSTLRTQRPMALPVLVTREPKRFASLPGGGLQPLVVPKPAWSWTILDAIRGRLNSDATQVKPR
jgi:hypothetical protein